MRGMKALALGLGGVTTFLVLTASVAAARDKPPNPTRPWEDRKAPPVPSRARLNGGNSAVVSATEPLTAVVAGLGLAGAALVRRRLKNGQPGD